MSTPIPLILRRRADTLREWMRFPVRSVTQGTYGNPGNPNVPLVMQHAPPSTAGWMRPVVPLGNPNVPLVPQIHPPTTAGWMRGVQALGTQVINPAVPLTVQNHPPTTQGWLRGVARRPNPHDGMTLDGWYPLTSTGDYQRYGAPVMGPWIEQLDPKLPANGLLHRTGMPDVRVRVIWNAGCQLYPSGAHVCRAFVREMGPADMIRFRLPNGFQGRAITHKLYTTPQGGLTDNPRVIQTEVLYKKAWLPSSFTNKKPEGISGTWVQVSPADARVGLVHIPGIGSQQAYVLQVKNDDWGRPRALVQWRSMTSVTARTPNNGANRGAFVVQTKLDKKGIRGVLAPSSTTAVRHDITEVTSRNPGNGRPLGTMRGGGGNHRSPVSVSAMRASVRRKNILHRMPWHGG